MVLAQYVCVAEQQGIRARGAGRHHPGRHPQGVHRPEGVDLPARAVDAADDRHDRVVHRRRCRAGTRCRSRATTSARRGRPPPRSWPSRSPTASPTSRPAWSGGCASTTSRRGCRSSSTPTSTSSRRSPSTARRAGSGRGRCASGTAPPAERSLLMRFHTQTAGVSLTAQQPEVNIVRTAIEALAAVMGGTQSLHTNSYDEALALPTEGAARLALRTQQVIAHETGVVHSADPLGGSWLVESMTDRIEAEALEYFDRIERLGGVLPRAGGELLPARDRRGQLSLPAGGRGRPAAGGGGQRATRPRTTTRSRSCASRPTSSGARPTAWRRCGSGGATPRCGGRWTRWRRPPRPTRT